ncbi:MAG: DNA polymerase III subunit delta' [Rhodospirillaceae bacterium]|nr:DNA polymerase III subunit delta' [Rhodospirillaceae bacterium]
MSDIDSALPRTTFDLIGHDRAEAAFLEAWNAGRMPHAWLITGLKGIGKATLAWRIARFVLSQDRGGGLFGDVPASLAVSEDDPVQHRITAGGHADLKVLERTGTDEKGARRRGDIPVEEVRGIGGFLSLTPAEGGWRVIIIDSADDMNRSSANALLKVLEEPPRNSLLLLVSHNPGRLLPTIRSRCRRLDLHPLSDGAVESLLRRAEPDLSPTDAALAIRMAEGSIGRALNLRAQGGLALYEEMTALLSTVPQLDIPALHAFADKVAADDDAFHSVADMLGWWLGRAATDHARGSRDDRDAGQGWRLIREAGLDRWCELWDKIIQSFARAEAVNLDRKQTVLNAFLALERICRP